MVQYIYSRPNYVTNAMQQSQEIPRLLWNPNVRYRVHKIQHLVHILIKGNSAHTPILVT